MHMLAVDTKVVGLEIVNVLAVDQEIFTWPFAPVPPVRVPLVLKAPPPPPPGPLPLDPEPLDDNRPFPPFPPPDGAVAPLVFEVCVRYTPAAAVPADEPPPPPPVPETPSAPLPPLNLTVPTDELANPPKAPVAELSAAEEPPLAITVVMFIK